MSQLEVSVGASGHSRIVSLPPMQASGGPGAVPGWWGVLGAAFPWLSPLQEELRPRLCCMKKGPNGFGFNLHSDKNRPGQYVRAVDPDSPAEAAGLAPQDRIIEVCMGRGLFSKKLGAPLYLGAQKGGAVCTVSPVPAVTQGAAT